MKELSDFLEEKLKDVEIEMTGSEIILKCKEDEMPFSRSYFRTLLRKFLHKAGLKDFRVIAGRDNSFVVKERKLRVQD